MKKLKLQIWRWVAALFVLHALPAQARAAGPFDFELYDLSERLVSLKKLQQGAKLVVVDFFSESCKPCKEAMPAWRRLHEQYSGRGLVLIIVAVPGVESDREVSKSEIDRFFKEKPVPFPVAWDKYSIVAKSYKVAQKGKLLLPQAFLLSNAGKLIRKSPTPKAIEAEIAKRLR
jgi:thiol-disulfide isomerase/thioredoxin